MDISWLERALEKKVPWEILSLVNSAFWILYPRRPKNIVIPLDGNTAVALRGRMLLPVVGGRVASPFPDEEYFKYLKAKEGETVLVAGACFGVSAVQAAKMVGKKGTIIAIEPEPTNLAYLKRNLSFFPNSIIISKAVTKHPGRVILNRSKTNPGGHTLLNFLGGDAIEVPADTIDNICFDLGIEKVDFIVMDVEGSEIEALQGGRKILKTASKVVVGAYHLRNGKPTWPHVSRFLKNLGFKVKISQDGLVHAWKFLSNSSTRNNVSNQYVGSPRLLPSGVSHRL